MHDAYHQDPAGSFSFIPQQDLRCKTWRQETGLFLANMLVYHVFFPTNIAIKLGVKTPAYHDHPGASRLFGPCFGRHDQFPWEFGINLVISLAMMVFVSLLEKSGAIF